MLRFTDNAWTTSGAEGALQMLHLLRRAVAREAVRTPESVLSVELQAMLTRGSVDCGVGQFMCQLRSHTILLVLRICVAGVPRSQRNLYRVERQD